MSQEIKSEISKENIEKLLDIGIALSAEKDASALLVLILDSVMELTNCDAGTLYLLEEDGLHFRIMRNHTLHTYQGQDGKEPDLPPVPLTRGSVCSLALLDDATICIDDVRNCDKYDLSVPITYDTITGYYTKSVLVVPMKNREGEQIGVLQLINAMDEEGQIISFNEGLIKAVESVASQAAVTIQNMRFLKEIKEFFWSLVCMISTAVDERTPYNLSHTRHMAQYGDRFIDYLRSKGMNFSDAHKEELLMSIWLHDIGKLVIPLEVMNKEARLVGVEYVALRNRLQMFELKNEIAYLKGEIDQAKFDEQNQKIIDLKLLVEEVNREYVLSDDMLERVAEFADLTFAAGDINQPYLSEHEAMLLSIKRGTLSEEERQIMQNHVVFTDKLLSEINFSGDLSHVREWASSHHELLDGSGYPDGKRGDEIPTEVRIITILDIFDALIADDRLYKPGLPVGSAIPILKSMAFQEGKLDKDLVEAFIASECWKDVQ